MDNKGKLVGGRIGKIYKVNDTVIRPFNKWTKDIHAFLQLLNKQGVGFVPKPYGINENGEEIISYVFGDVYNYPLPENFLMDSMIISAAKLLYNFHNHSRKYITNLKFNEHWMLPVLFPIEVMCHGDFAPYNVTIVNDLAYGIIDFDTLHPGPRIWDVSYAVYRWVPLECSSISGYKNNLHEQIRKTKFF